MFAGAPLPHARASGLEYISQHRAIHADSTLEPDYFTDVVDAAANDFGEFDKQVQTTSLHDGYPAGPSIASQDSSLGDYQIKTAGYVYGIDNYSHFGAGSGEGSSRLDVWFSITESKPYQMLASISANHTASGGNFFSGQGWLAQLSDAEGNILAKWSTTYWSGGNPPPILNVDFSGTLPAGSYEFQANFEDGYGGYGVWGYGHDYSASLSVPEPSSVFAIWGVLILLGARGWANRAGC